MSTRPQPEPNERLHIKDVARLAGVSTGTVSRALNKRGRIAPATRERILRIVEQTGFVRNASALSLVGSRTGIVEVVVTSVIDEYFGQVILGINQALRPAGYSILLRLHVPDEERERYYAGQLSRRTADGALLIVPKHVNEGELLRQYQRGYPLVVVDHRSGDPAVPSVSASHYEGARQAVAHLLELGHRHIAIITGDLSEHSGRERLRGYREALAQVGMPRSGEDVVEGDYSPGSGADAMRRLLRQAAPPTAVFACNDHMARAALDVIKEAGLAIPRDISIVGFDDFPFAAATTPPLTTVRQPLDDIGRVAATMLLDLIDGQPLADTHVRLQTALVLRSTTGLPR
ncbi:MAG: transcriptional regulator, LacI family [Chloroflexi bacterium]|jgi:LacI family transcriptional regulator|nr:transcriptional regulator, LacI family [Chloroflexota bacterium]